MLPITCPFCPITIPTLFAGIRISSGGLRGLGANTLTGTGVLAGGDIAVVVGGVPIADVACCGGGTASAGVGSWWVVGDASAESV